MERKVVIEVDNVVKDFFVRRAAKRNLASFLFPQFKPFRALNDVSLEVFHGETFGLLGPNGSGKTTLIKLLCGLLEPNEGSVTVAGLPAERAEQKIGVMLGYSLIYNRLTGYDNLKYYARLYHVKNPDRRIKELAEWLGLNSWLNSFVENYSVGMKSKLALARALVHNPEIVLLDEPTLGLDPKMSASVRKEIKDMGKTIVLTTHYLEEANEVCDRIAIINKGKISVVDTPERLKRLVSRNIVVCITLGKGIDALEARLRKADFAKSVFRAAGALKVLLESKKELPELLNAISRFDVLTITQEEPNLNDVFLKFTGEKAWA